MIGAIILLGSKNYNNVDVIAHEYTHAVSKVLVCWNGDFNETAALNEAYSDIFGEIIEAKINNTTPDWLSGDRNIIEPQKSFYDTCYYEIRGMECPLAKKGKHVQNKDHTYKNSLFEKTCITKSNYPDSINSDYYDEDLDCHINSIIISHAAYLMWNGIDGSERIDCDTLAKLWYNTLFLMQTNPTFSQCRNAVELSARIMMKNNELDMEQYLCVCNTFNAVGIEKAGISYKYCVDNDFNLKVLGSKKTGNTKFELSIYKLPENPFDSEFYINEKERFISEEKGLTDNKNIHLDDGTYKLIISPVETNYGYAQPITIRINVDGEYSNARDEVVVYTEFDDLTIVTLNENYEDVYYEDVYYQYINENIVTSQGYCREYEESFSNIPESDIYFKMKDIKGISSAFIKDLNNDSILEMITVSMLGKGSAKDTGYYEDSIMVDIHCYSLDKSNNVVDCGSACSIDTFKNADEQVYVYFSTGREPRICISRNYWSGNSSAATIFGQAFTTYTFSNELIEKESVLYRFSHGNETYTINGSESSIDVAIDKADNVFKSLGLEELSINKGWNKFPKNSEKICTFGTNYSKDDSYKVYIVDYTDLQQHMDDKYSNNNQEQTTAKTTAEESNTGSFPGNKTAEQLRKSIIGYWEGIYDSTSYEFVEDGTAYWFTQKQKPGTYKISDDKTLTISFPWTNDEYTWSELSFDEFHKSHDYDEYFWHMTDDGVLMINGAEYYRDGKITYNYDTSGDLLAYISGVWISDKGYEEFQINNDGTWIESTVTVSGGTLINRTKLDNGKVEIVDDTTAKLWQEVNSLSQIPGASELIYDSKNDKISVGGTNNTYSRAKYQ